MKTYKQTLRALFTTGISLLVLCIAISFFTIFSSNDLDSGTFDIAYVLGIAALFMYLGSVLLTFRAFRYLNNRVESDFYDSLPEKRVSTYLQKVLAILTYQLPIVIVSALVLILTLAINDIPMLWSIRIRLMLPAIAGSVLMVGGLSLAKSLTGTTLSAIALGFIILFLPRIILSIVPIIINNTTHGFISLGSLGALLDIKYNIPFFASTFIYNPFRYLDYELQVVLSTGPIIYSTLLGLVYMAMGAFAFKRRKSELAGKGCIKDIHGYIQSALLILVILIFVSHVQLENFLFDKERIGNVFEWLYTDVLFYVIILFGVYLAFTLVYTRKLKSILKSMPFYLISVVLCAGIFVSSYYIANAIKYRVPQTEDIESVTIIENSFASLDAFMGFDYSDVLNRDVEFTDSEMINMMQSELNDIVYPPENTLDPMYNSDMGYGDEVTCIFNLKSGGSMTRIIEIPPDDKQKFVDLLHANATFYANTMSIPPLDSLEDITFYSFSNKYADILTKEQVNEIWNSYIMEYPIAEGEIYSHYLENNQHYKLFIYTTVAGKHKGKHFHDSFTITSREVDTSNLLLTMLNESGISIHRSWDSVVADLSSYESVSVSMKLHDRVYALSDVENRHEIKLNHVYKPLLDDEAAVDKNRKTQVKLDKILDIIDNIDYKDIDSTKSFIMIRYSYTTLDGETLPNNILFLSLTDEQASRIFEIITEAGDTQ